MIKSKVFPISNWLAAKAAKISSESLPSQFVLTFSLTFMCNVNDKTAFPAQTGENFSSKQTMNRIINSTLRDFDLESLTVTILIQSLIVKFLLTLSIVTKSLTALA